MNRRRVTLIALGCMVIGPTIIGDVSKPLVPPKQGGSNVQQPNTPPPGKQTGSNGSSIGSEKTMEDSTCKQSMRSAKKNACKDELIKLVASAQKKHGDIYAVLTAVVKSPELQYLSKEYDNIDELYKELSERGEPFVATVYGAVRFIHSYEMQKEITNIDTLSKLNLEHSIKYVQDIYNALKNGNLPAEPDNIPTCLKRAIVAAAAQCGKKEEELGKEVYRRALDCIFRSFIEAADKKYKWLPPSDTK
jgi:hypothetical protein